MRRRARLLGWSLVSMLSLAACGADRPSTAAWASTWSSAQARMPTAAALIDGGPERCDELVGELRDVKDALEPAPTEALDAAVDAWVAHAESIAFDCPADADQLDARYAQLDALAREVDAGLDLGA